jgi:transcriptional antiterminator RfaH
MKKWYLIKTKPRQEKIAIYNLEAQGYIVYCPKGEINKKIVILFSGYLFIQLDKNIQNWSPIRSTKGVSNFVKFGIDFATIPNSIIDFIHKNEQFTLQKIKDLNQFQPGQDIQITEGVFKNCTAIFKSFKSDDRVILLLKLMGQQQVIDVKKKSLIGL